MIEAIENGAVNLYFDNDKKLETVTGGVTVSGTATATGASTGDLTIAAAKLEVSGIVIGSADINEAELEILDGATVSTTELNVLDGICLLYTSPSPRD